MAAGATAPLFQPRCLERGRNRILQAHLAPVPAGEAGLLGRGFGRCRVDWFQSTRLRWMMSRAISIFATPSI